MKTNKKTKLYEWQKKYKHVEQVCPKCNRFREITIDHIIPVSILVELGLENEAVNDEENFELICRTCNRFKANRIDIANPKTIPLLKKYINLL